MQRYNYLEPTLQKINKQFISLSEDEEKRNNEALDFVIQGMLEKMKKVSPLFRQLFTTIFYGGSYYEGLRVGEPNEYDLNLLLKLPKELEPVIKSATNVPGYVVAQFRNDAVYQRVPGLDNLTTPNNYLDTELTLQWMERVIRLALNELPSSQYPGTSTVLGVENHGPAFTLTVRNMFKHKEIHIDIDLVPCFVFEADQWPQNGFRANPVRSKPNFFIVPKPLKKDLPNKSYYWRLAFQEQERVLMSDKQALKPTIKLMKQLRDRYDNQHCIASYYLKTVVLWQIVAKNEDFWENSLSYIFITMLRAYYEFLSKGEIPFFWNKNYNLIENINRIEISNIASKIKSIIDEVDRSQDPMVIARHLLTQDQLSELHYG